MNWTGGSLQRTKNARKGTRQAQKAYFARVRTNNHQNDSCSPGAPFRPDKPGKFENSKPHAGTRALERPLVHHSGCWSQARKGPIHRVPSTQEAAKRAKDSLGLPNPNRLSVSDCADLSLVGTCIGTTPNKGHGKRKAEADTSSETRKLEASKKRLLNQLDWVGIKSTRPVHLHFQSAQEKTTIGKRRKLGIHNASASRDQVPYHHMKRQFGPADVNNEEIFKSGALRSRPEHVRIRIGADAFSTVCSSRHDDCSQSPTSSDLMLFDEQTTRVNQCSQQIQPASLLDGHGVRQNLTSCKRDDGNSRVPERPRDGCSMPRYDTSTMASPKLHLQCSKDAKDASTPLENSACVKDGPTGAFTTPTPLMVQHVHGQHRSWRLVFGTCNSPSEKHNYSTSQLDRDSGAPQILEPCHAGISQFSHVPLRESGAVDMFQLAAATADIVDEEPWKSFLAIPGVDPSHSINWTGDESSIVHLHSTTPYNAGVPDVWSHHATLGAPTTLISSDNSTVLPSKKRISEASAPAHPRKKAGSCRQNMQGGTTCPASIDVDEKLWRDFVFGGNEEQSSERLYQDCGESEVNREKGSSGYLPFSVAVSSIRPSPTRPASGVASCLGDGAQNATRFGHSSWSKEVSSPVALPALPFRDLGRAEEGDEWVELGATGDESVGHTSLQNITSSATELGLSGGTRNTGTSRGGTGECMLKYAHASSSVSQRVIANLPFDDCSGDDSGGLDIIDAERLA